MSLKHSPPGSFHRFFDPKVDAKEVDLDAKDNDRRVLQQFYSSVTQQGSGETYYDGIKEADTSNRSQIGFNTRLVKENGKLVEQVWKSGGMYGAAIDKIIYWLEKAEGVAETPEQKATIAKLITLYRSGDPKHFDDYSIAWVQDTSARRFRERIHRGVSGCPCRRRAHETSYRSKTWKRRSGSRPFPREAQWFEDHSPIMDDHKKRS